MWMWGRRLCFFLGKASSLFIVHQMAQAGEYVLKVLPPEPATLLSSPAELGGGVWQI